MAPVADFGSYTWSGEAIFLIAPTVGLGQINSMAEKLSPSNIRPKPSKEVLSRNNMDGTLAIMNLDRDDVFFTLDGLAVKCWHLMDGKNSLTTIAANVTKNQPSETKFVEKKLLELVKQLQREKLVEL